MPDTIDAEAFCDCVEGFMPYFIRFINPILHKFKTEEFTLNENQIKVLMAVNLARKISPSQLSSLFIIPKTSLTTIVRSLINRELIERRDSPEDERMYYLTVTPSGKDLIARKHRENIEQFRELFRALPPEEYEKIIAGFTSMKTYLSSKEPIPHEKKII